MNRIRHILIIIVLCLNAVTAFAWTGKVIRVVDGDTIEINYQGQKEKVRLLGVNTPESVHRDKTRNVPMGTVASDYTNKRLSGKQLILEIGDPTRGKYGRLLAYVFIGGQNFNLELVRQGLSPYYTKYGTSVKYDSEFREAERLARKDRLNIWGDSTLTRIYRQKIAEWKQYYQKSKAELKSLDGMYVGSSKSLKVHRPNCKWGQLISDKNKVVFKSKQDAFGAGYIACKVCKPY